MADYKYQNLNPKYDDTRYKINNSVLRMMNSNPALGTGYIIGSMLGENYWGKKRAKRQSEVENAWKDYQNSNGATVYSPTTPTANSTEEKPQAAKTNWAEEANKALEAYKKSGANGDVKYQGMPQTPQQANKSTEVPTVAKQWQDMANGSSYNPGGTVLYTGGVRDLGNVVPQNTPSVANFPQKPANGPAPYTDDQLRQIAAQNYSPEELARHATPQEIQRMNALVNPTPAVASSGGLLGPIAEAVAPASNAYIPQVDMREEQGYGTPDPAPNLPVQNTTSTPIPEAAPNIPVVNASPSTTSTAPESGLTDGVYNNMNWLARKRAEEQNNPSNWTLNLARLLTPSNSPYYSQKEIEEAYSQPLIARK